LKWTTAKWSLDSKDILDSEFVREVDIDVKLPAHNWLLSGWRVNRHRTDRA